jgi:hypothetical protein
MMLFVAGHCNVSIVATFTHAAAVVCAKGKAHVCSLVARHVLAHFLVLLLGKTKRLGLDSELFCHI